VTLVAKTNVLRFAHNLWLRAFEAVKADFPGIDTDYHHVDACTMYMVTKPKIYDVIVTTNMFGDIITDLGAAIQESINTRAGVERCIRYAFDYCRKRHASELWRGLHPGERAKGYRGQLTLVAKTNVLTYAHDLWMRTFDEVSKEYPDVKTDYNHVDACCMWMIKSPEQYDVIVTTNMFGDIITDLAAMLQGGLGVAAGGNINPRGVSMFEPMGGSAPKYAGKGMINPIAAIMAGMMMLDFLGEERAARRVERAVERVTQKMSGMAAGKMGFTTGQVGDLVVEALDGDGEG